MKFICFITFLKGQGYSLYFYYVFIVGKVHLAQHLDHETAASGSYPSGGNDNVDYGAYTGGYGAFGWYTDHPVGNYGSY